MWRYLHLLYLVGLASSEIYRLDFSFDGKPNGNVFQPGETVKGTAHFYNDKPDITNVQLKLIGDARAVDIDDKKIKDRVYIKYFEEEKTLYSDKKPLGEGTHDFKFSLKLPKHIPTSYEYGNNAIRHYLQISGVKINRIQCLVVADVDLSNDGSYEKPASVECKLKVGLIKKSDFNIKMSLPKTGYVLGEPIRLNAPLENHSSYKIDKVFGELAIYTNFLTVRNGRVFGVGDAPLKPTDANVKVHTSDNAQAARLFEPSSDEGKLEKQTLHLEIMSSKAGDAPTMKLGIVPFAYIEWYVRVYVKFDSFLQDKLMCRIPVTIGTIPTKSVSFKHADSYALPNYGRGLLDDGEATKWHGGHVYPVYAQFGKSQ
ncbi:unnamed protein product [Caenorhabditis bovis]|uniref:Arrestin C-terminal-like domain-containing protein n=1 Tax=Caenorhabditis bovis TaxID=2654633 RepID=A0A8S1EZ44_9PELO|nr:unnamed protein product [Caenorhabditis bovis]